MPVQKLVLTALTSVLMAPAALAHDAWIEASRADEAPETVEIGFFIGHAGENDTWPAYPDRVSGFTSASQDGVRDLQGLLSREDRTGPLAVTLDTDKSHILTVNTFRVFIELETEKFNAYAEEEGITPIIRTRAAAGTFNTPGTELYSRHLKTVIPATGAACLSAAVARPLGQRLEIIPVDAATGDDDTPLLTVEVRYLGEPIAGVTLHMNDIVAGEATAKPLTDEAGRATLVLPTSHAWYVHAAWSEPLPAPEQGADFLTAFASLSIMTQNGSNAVCIADN